MLSRAHLAAAVDRMQGSAATALALVLVVLAFVYLVPRQGDIAAFMNARHAEAVAEAEAERTAPVAQPAPPATEAPAPEQASLPEAAPPAAPAPPSTDVAATPPQAPPPGRRESQLLARPVVLDTATILIRQGKVRLAGIKSAPLSRKCGEDGPRGWFCGVEARTHFRSWLRARSINCEVPPAFGDKAEEVEARCDLAGEDIANWLVANGYAEASNATYSAAEREAKAAKLGIWAQKRPAD